jgi:hypothetical protein
VPFILLLKPIMKKITIILIAALFLTSCSKLMKSKLAEAAGKDRQQQRSTTKLSEAPPENDYKNNGLVSGYTIASTGSTATYAVQDASAERKEEDKPVGNATVSIPTTQPRMETKVPSKIIRNASISFQVDSTDRSSAHIVQLLAMYQAYFGSDSRVQYGDRIQQHMSIRDPC